MSNTKDETKKKTEKQKGSDILNREDFTAGPSNLDCIEKGLFLAATDQACLAKNKINYILTVDSCPLPLKVTMIPSLKFKYIQVTDTPREDLLSCFDETAEFISEAQENGAVLVHCYFGVSRSATIVIAFIMKKYEISFKEAFERVLEKRRFVRPNPGFESQLQLYETMGYKIDKTNIQFRLYRLQIAADNVKKAKILPQSCTDVVKGDPGLITVKPEPLVYRCRKCRRIVASASNLLPHLPKEKPSWTDEKWTKSSSSSSSQPLSLCSQTYFIEPLAWMSTIGQHLQGKLHCQNANPN